MLGTSDAWSMSRLSHQASEPAYYIEDCRISTTAAWVLLAWTEKHRVRMVNDASCIIEGKITLRSFQIPRHNAYKTASKMNLSSKSNI